MSVTRRSRRPSHRCGGGPADQEWLKIGIDDFAGNARALKRFARLYRNRPEVIASDRGGALGRVGGDLVDLR
jgi:hypothetical protein